VTHYRLLIATRYLYMCIYKILFYCSWFLASTAYWSCQQYWWS